MVLVHKAADGAYLQSIEVGGNTLVADASVAAGGAAAGPDPHDLLDAALGACTAITVTMVARRKQIPLTDVRVEIAHEEGGGLYKMKRTITFVGDLTDEQRTYLLGIANKCPVHKTLSGRIEIDTALQPTTS